MAKEEMRIEYVRLADVQSAPRNPKAHDHVQLDASVRRFGFADPPIEDGRTGKLVAGHGRIEALGRLKAAGEKPPARVRMAKDGEWLVPIVKGMRFKNDREAEAFLLAHNRIGDSLWDNAQLEAVLAEHRDDLAGMGWTDLEVDRILADEEDFNANEEWKGMPEFDNQDKTAHRQIVVSFRSDEDAEAFGRLLGQNVSDKTRALWYPEAERESAADKRYAAE